jgi:hypothetical protein
MPRVLGNFALLDQSVHLYSAERSLGIDLEA